MCTGSTFGREDAEVCHHCGHTTPHPDDAYDDEDQEHGEQLHAAEVDR
ncbi:hypothetical protein ACR31U_35035 (plasmid) [Streptomyces rochei]